MSLYFFILKKKIMEIVGRLIQLLPPVTGEGKNGAWKKQSFVIEIQSDYPKKICFVTWGDKVDLNSMTESDTLKVYFEPESREYNGNWYTDLRAWKIEIMSAGGTPVSGNTPPLPTENDIPPLMMEEEDGDDLPF